MTTQDSKAEILAELWLNYRDDINFEDFISYNELYQMVDVVLVDKDE